MHDCVVVGDGLEPADGRRGSPRAGRPGSGRWCGRAGSARRPSTTVSVGSRPASEVVELGERRRPGRPRGAPRGPTGIAGEVPRRCACGSRASRALAAIVDRSARRAARAWSTITSATIAERRRRRRRPPASTSTRSPNSHGRPRQPRPTTTPSQPVARIIATASDASQMSPLPSTGIDGTCCLELADRVPAGVAGVVLLDGAGVQRDRRHALLGADRAGAQVGRQRRADPCGTWRSPARRTGAPPATAARTIARSRPGLAGTAAPPPLRVTLAAGQPKLRSMWSTRPSSHTRSHGPAHHRRVAAVDLQAARAARRGRTSSSARSWRCRARRRSPSPSR